MFQVIMKTTSDTESRGNLQFFYKCKGCGYVNELLRLCASNEDNSIASIVGQETHESLCHKCDDIEILTIEVREKA